MRVGGADPEAVSGAAPRSASRLVVATFKLYRCYPLLFLTLAGGVVVPYFLIVLATSGDGPFAVANRSGGVELLLSLLMWCLITPLISALHINAVAEVREGRRPVLTSVARAGFGVLPAVVAASIMSGFGILLGFVALVIPGIYLTLRWVVVAQAAAIEREGWLPALRSSGRLVSGHYGHVFVFAIFVAVVVTAPFYLIELAVEDAGEIVSSVVGLIVGILTLSFGALATALLYFDLRVRYEAVSPSFSTEAPPGERSVDSSEYSEGERPKGWYVDPANPRRMRYWAGESSGWQGSTKTPRKIREEWEANEGSEE